MPSVRKLLAGLAALGLGLGAAVVVTAQSEPAIEHVSVRAGEGLWTVASRLCPHNVTQQYQALQQANPFWTLGLHPGTVLHVPEGSCPPSTTTTTTVAPTTTSPWVTTAPTTTTSTSTSTSTTTPGWSGVGPNPALRPTAATTGPQRSITTTRAGGNIPAGTYQRTRFTSGIDTGNHIVLRDCIVDGDLYLRGTAVIENCRINGRLTITSSSRSASYAGVQIRRSWIESPSTVEDLIRFQNCCTWGDQSYYLNIVIEDTVFVSNYRGAPGAHFDVLQTGGGRNITMNRVVLRYTNPILDAGATAYVNNGEESPNFTITDFWFEGGPVAWVVGGEMALTNGLIERSTRYYFYVFPELHTTLVNVVDDLGRPIS